MLTRAKKMLKFGRRYTEYLRDWSALRQLMVTQQDHRFQLKWRDRMPALWEKSSTTSFDAHYVYHNAWAVRQVRNVGPTKHVDISSTLYFCSTLSAILPVEFYDYRPAQLTLSNLTCGSANLSDLQFANGSIESLSCMHTIEHVGLGRYGDALDPKGDLNAASELVRVLAPGGYLLMVVPTGKSRVQFNAHRIYDFHQVLAMFGSLDLLSCALVTDAGHFLENPTPAVFDEQSYGCGCYFFKKPMTDAIGS